MDFLPLDRSGNRRFLPVTVDASKADCHILDNPAESRHYFEQLWAEIMVQYKSGAYSTHLSKEDEDALRKQQQDYCQEDTLAGRIYAWFETFEQDKAVLRPRRCSRQTSAVQAAGFAPSHTVAHTWRICGHCGTSATR